MTIKTTERIIKAGLKGFLRNKTISISSIFVLTITLLIMSNIFIVKGLFQHSVTQVQDKVSITVFFKKEANEIDLARVRDSLQVLPEIKSITYVSKEDNLNIFKEDHKNNPEQLAALEEIGVNPFGSSFVIQAKDTEQYEAIINKINQDAILGEDFKLIDKINYVDIKDSINKLNNILTWIDRVGGVVLIVFIVMSILIVYNTTRLAIFSFKEEVSIMKLVGASNMYIRGPFIVEAGLHGAIASVVTVALLYPLTNFINSKTYSYFGGFSIFEFYKQNISVLFVGLFISGVVVAIISSIFAVRKYLGK